MSSPRRRPAPRTKAVVRPPSATGSLHGPAIGFRPGYALPVGGPITLTRGDVELDIPNDDSGRKTDPILYEELKPNLNMEDLQSDRGMVDTMVWELKSGHFTNGKPMYRYFQAVTVWRIYLAAGNQATTPENPFTREPMGRDDYEALKKMYLKHKVLRNDELESMRLLERNQGWGTQTPYVPSEEYTKRQEFLRNRHAAAAKEPENYVVRGRIYLWQEFGERMQDDYQNKTSQEYRTTMIQMVTDLLDDHITADNLKNLQVTLSMPIELPRWSTEDEKRDREPEPSHYRCVRFELSTDDSNVAVTFKDFINKWTYDDNSRYQTSDLFALRWAVLLGIEKQKVIRGVAVSTTTFIVTKFRFAGGHREDPSLGKLPRTRNDVLIRYY